MQLNLCCRQNGREPPDIPCSLHPGSGLKLRKGEGHTMEVTRGKRVFPLAREFLHCHLEPRSLISSERPLPAWKGAVLRAARCPPPRLPALTLGCFPKVPSAVLLSSHLTAVGPEVQLPSPTEFAFEE